MGVRRTLRPFGDEKGNVIAVTFANSPKCLEDFFREKTIEMGLSI